jgi:phosphoglycerate dehydrogenase-like enzyme
LAAATQARVLIALGSSDLESMERIASSTVELTFGLMLALLRRIPQTHQSIAEGNWPNVLGHTLAGKKLGILGLGRMGRGVARIARAFEMDVVAWGPTLTNERALESAVTRVELDSLLESSDVVSVHLKLSEQSRGLLDEARLRRIGPSSYLINTARGAIVDEAALARVLRDGALGGAGLDVFVEEPLPANSPLRGLDNVVMTSHLGWPADLTYRCFATAVADIVEAYLNGAPFRALNPEAATKP